MFGVQQNHEHHAEGDVFEHTMRCLDSIPDDQRTPALAWAVLLHDVGKRASADFPENVLMREQHGKNTFIGHDDAGAVIADEMLRQFAVADRELIVESIRQHMRIRDLHGMRRSKQLAMLNNPCMPLLMQLSRADSLGSLRPDGTCNTKGQPEIEAIYQEFVNAPPEKKLPSVKADFGIDGHTLMQAGVKPGPVMGRVLKALEEYYRDNPGTSMEELMKLVDIGGK